MIVLIGSIGVFGVLTAIDGFQDNIPITLLKDDIGLVNKNPYSENYGEYVLLFEYPVYRFVITGKSVLFTVTDNDRFTEYLICLDSFMDEYDLGDFTIYVFQKDGGVYYLSKLDRGDRYALFPAFEKIGGEAYVPIAPCEYFKLGTYSSYSSGDFHSLTTLSWDEIKAHYITFYSDNITIDNDQMQITLIIDSSIEYLISYSNFSIHIELVE